MSSMPLFKWIAFVVRLPLILLACIPATLTHADVKADIGALQIIVPFGPGGGADQLARESAILLNSLLSTPVEVTNIPGATGNAGIAKLIAAPNDGHTMAILTADTFALLAYLNPGWKPIDIVPLGIMMKQHSALFLPATSRFKTWGDFEKEARQRPDTLRVAITGLGSPDYLMLQQLFAKGIKLVPVPMANPVERYRAMSDGKADALYEQYGDVRAFVDEKKIRPILMFSAARVPAFADVPASRELGLGDGFDQFRAIVVKAGTDPAKIKTLSDALAKVAGTPQYKTFLETQAASNDSYIASKDAAAFLQTQLDAMKKIVQALPLHARYIFDNDEIERYLDTF